MKMLLSAVRSLAISLAALSLAQFAHAQGKGGTGSGTAYTVFSPSYITLQGKVDYSNPGQYTLHITTPTDFPATSSGAISINFATLASGGGQPLPTGVSDATALSYISAQTTTGTVLTVGGTILNTLPFTGGGVPLTVIVTMTVPANVTAGNYGYLVTVNWPTKDNAGNTLPATIDGSISATSGSLVVGSTVNATVVTSNPPIITIASPTANQTFTALGGSLGSISAVPYTFSATATASGATISSITGYFVNNASPNQPIDFDALTMTTSNLGTATATVSGIQDLAPGSYTLFATATDTYFNSIDTATTFSVVTGVPPTIAITTPTTNAVFAISTGGTTAAVPINFQGGLLSATLADTVTVSLVGANTGTVPFSPVVGGLTTSANINSLTTLNLPADTYTLTVTDADGFGSATATATFTVGIPATPTITINAPTATPAILIPIGSTTATVPYNIVGSTGGGAIDNAIVSASGTLYSGAAASGTVAATVAQSSFTGIGTASVSATGSFTLGAGTYTLAATDSNASSSGGQSVTATPVTFTVVQEIAPTIAITAPANGSTIVIPAGQTSVTPSFTILGGTTYGTITSDGAALVTGSSPSPSGTPVSGFSATYTGTGTASISSIGSLPALTAGTYTLSATDSNGLSGGTATAASTFTVVQAASPSVTITAPATTITIPIGSTTVAVTYGFTGTTSGGTSYTTLTSAGATLVDGSGNSIAITPTVANLGSANITGSGTVTLGAGTYTLTATDSNGAPNGSGGTVSATASETFTVVQAATPTISINAPTTAPAILIPIGSTTVAVPYSIVGSTGGGTIDTAIVSASGTLYSGAAASGTVAATVAQSGFTGIGTASVSATGSFTLGAGTYTLAATESNVGSSGGESVNATPVTFTVIQELAPTITITAPANGSTITIPSGKTSVTPSFAISGGTNYGTITSDSAALVTGSSPSPAGTPVTGFAATFTGTGTTSISSAGTLPALTAGTYTLSATDSNGLAGGSATALTTFTVVQAATPTVSITAPATTITIPAGATAVAVAYGFTGATSGGTAYSTLTSAGATLVNGSGTSVPITPTIATLGSATLTGSGSVTLGVGTYTLTATDSNGAPNGSGGTVSATASETFTVVQAATPTIAISAPTSNQSFTIPAGSTTTSVSFAFSGATTGGTLFTTVSSAGATLVSSTGTSYPITPTIANLGTANITGSGSVSLPAGTYTLTATDSNGAPTAAGGVYTASASVTFTLVQGQSTGGTGGGSSSTNATPSVCITSPTSNQSFTIPVGSTTTSVAYTFTGGTSGGTLYNSITAVGAMITNSSGTSTQLSPTVNHLNTSSITGSGSLTLAAGTYTLTVLDSNGATLASGAPNIVSASVTFKVVQGVASATPSIKIVTPTSGQSFAISTGSTTTSVSYTFTGGTSGGTLYNTITSVGAQITNSSGTVTVLSPTVSNLNTSSITGSGSLTLPAGTYTLEVLDSNGAPLPSGAPDIVSASVTFTVAAAPNPECLVWLQGDCGNQSNCEGGKGYGNCGGYNNLGNYCNSGGYCSNSATQNVCGGTVVPIAFALYSCSTSNNCNGSWGHYNFGTGCSGNFVTDKTDVISISEVYNDKTSSNPVVYSYSATSSNPPYFTITNNEYLLNFPTAAGTHHYAVEVYHPETSGSLTLLGSEDIYTNSSHLPSSCTNTCYFNGTSIAKGSTIWFNSIIQPHCSSSQTQNLVFDSSTITFTANGAKVTLNVPAAAIQFSPTATTATTTFNASTNSWVTTVPANYTGNVFLTGVAYTVPATINGNIGGVSWSGAFRSDCSSVAAGWQWAAAVYTQFSTTMNSLGIKPVDSSSLSSYKNSDRAGTPENYKQYVTAGACGSGGSNWTGTCTNTCWAQSLNSCWSNSCNLTSDWGWSQYGDGSGCNISCGGAWGNGGSGSSTCGNAGTGRGEGAFCSGWDSSGNCSHHD